MRLALPCNWEERTGGGPEPPSTLRFRAHEPLGLRAIRKMASGAAMHLSEANGAWSGRPDLNRRPQRPERCALTSCATPRRIPYYNGKAESRERGIAEKTRLSLRQKKTSRRGMPCGV